MFVFIYIFIDGMAWVTSGLLTAAGDTKFLMYVNMINVWLFAVLPIYLMVSIWDISPEYTWLVINFYAGMNILFFLWRVRQQRWRSESLIT